MRKVAVILLSLAMLSTINLATTTSVKQGQIALYNCPSSEGTQIIYNLLISEGYNVVYITKEDVEAGALENFDLALFPGGSEHVYAFLLSCRFRCQLRRYIWNGGKYIGVCGGAAVGVWTIKGFNLLSGLAYLEAYLHYLVFGHLTFRIEWQPENSFDKTGKQLMVWGGGPQLGALTTFKTEAVYDENKYLIFYKGKPAISSGTYGQGKMILFGTHPEYPVNGQDNTDLLLKALELMA